MNRLACALLAFAFLQAEGADPGGERGLEIGGLVTLDHQSDLRLAGDPELTLKQVALEAKVSISPELVASVMLKAERELDRIFFDQAMASFSPAGSPWSLFFGHQGFNHGLLSTRLISDPDLLGQVEVKLPGMAIAYAWESLSASAGFLLWETPSPDGRSSRDYALLPALDGRRGPVAFRISGFFSRYKSDGDVAISIASGKWLLDAEVFTDATAWDAGPGSGGYYAGAEYQALPWLSMAFRHDGTGASGLEELESLRYAAGLTFNLKHDLFAAMEYSYRQLGGETGPRLALQMGLKSNLNLPGFQRATLSRD